MKRYLILTTLLLISIAAFTKNGPGDETTSVDSESANTSMEVVNSSEEVVINLKMIEKYNNATLPEGYVNFRTLIEDKSFSDLSTLVSAYRTGQIELLTEESICDHLNNDNTLILLSEKDTNMNTE